MCAASDTGVRHALVGPEVPVEMAIFFGSALVCGQEASAAGTALVWLRIVECVNQFWPEDFEGCSIHWYSWFSSVGELSGR